MLHQGGQWRRRAVDTGQGVTDGRSYEGRAGEVKATQATIMNKGRKLLNVTINVGSFPAPRDAHARPHCSS
ncbi:hypothetical protein E2C01_098012 [Portunus trituberculatus]|uniref:Uncharacterized protein n=1 Tax=Portunus trituberculatus TaxID=210409 RepID=A0A5B7KBS5_PORTR|nr:hypothetical protein [Portunus trituberculatus]